MNVAGRTLTPAVVEALTYWPSLVHAEEPKPVDLAVLPPPARLEGNAAKALAAMDEANALGMDPTALLRGLMEALHSATRAKAAAQTEALLSAEQREFADRGAPLRRRLIEECERLLTVIDGS